MSDISELCRPKDEESLVRAVIDGMLDGRASAHQALLGVPALAFTHYPARDIWESILRVYNSGQMPDLPNLERDLMDNRKIKSEDGWFTYLHWLEGGTSSNEAALAASVIGLWQRRELWRLYQGHMDSVLNPLEDHLEIAQAVACESLRIIAGGADEPLDSGDAIVAMAESRLKFREDQEGSGKLAWFGIPILDGEPSAGGVPAAPGHVVIIPARPGVGKTAWAVQIAVETAKRSQNVLFCSLEMNRYELWGRIAGHVTDTKRGCYWHGNYSDYHVGRLRAQMTELNRIKVWDPARPSWSRIEAKIRGAALRGMNVCIIDHFSEINLAGLMGKGGKKFEAAGECAQRIKALAKDLGICIVLLAQFNREIPRGEMPGSEHLRETGELEQIAYSILALYRDAPAAKAPSIRDSGPDAPPPIQPQLRMAVIKNRDGKAGYQRRFDLDGAICKVRDMDDQP